MRNEFESGESAMLTPGSHVVSQVRAEVLPPVDVAVIGGGTAGVIAALAAARGGAKTVLVESRGYLGGMLTAGNAGITMYIKFSGRPEEHDIDVKQLKSDPRELQIAGGITMELTNRMLAEGIAIGNEGTAGSYVFTSSEDFKRLLFLMMKEAGVEVRLHSLFADAVKDGDRISGVALESKSGRQFLPATQVIDASGDGDVAARAGAEYTVGVTGRDLCAAEAKIGEMMNMGVMFRVGNVDLETCFDWLEKNPQHFRKQPFARFTFEEARERMRRGENATINIIREHETPGGFQVYNLPTPGMVTLCCPQLKGFDGCRVEDLSRAEVMMAEMLERWMKSIRTIPGFERSFLAQVPEMGVRETRHITGDHLLTIEDIYHRTHFADCIGFGAHPIDTHPRPAWLNDPETAYPPRWHFEIPYRSLLVKGLANLQTAGRCISATHEAFGCIRPTVQCMIIGEAAGTAAALAVKQGVDPRALDVEVLRNTLKANGGLC